MTAAAAITVARSGTRHRQELLLFDCCSWPQKRTLPGAKIANKAAVHPMTQAKAFVNRRLGKPRWSPREM
jgi:hypothetical protein